MTLARALKAKTDEERLEHLLEAWRDCRHPRLADLVDRVAEPLVKAAGPVKAKSVPARTEECIKLAASKDPVALGRVLITEWPGTWQPALPLLQAVCKAPDDPRVAAHFAKQIDVTRYDTWTSSNYWHPLFARLRALKDVRQLPLLKAQLERAKGEYYARDMRPAEEGIVKLYAALEVPKLSAADEKALSTLEAPFAGAKASARTNSKSGDELLAAVYANPGDHSLRLVYGDWLVSQNDPRGELISLQAAPLTDKSRTRIRTLIKKHWQQWLGPVRDWLREPPGFTLGFPSSASVDTSNYSQRDLLEKIIERPEWRTVEWIRQWPYFNDYPLAKALAHPNFARVTRLSEVRDRELPAILELGPPVVDMEIAGAPDELTRIDLSRLKQLKTLRLGHPQLIKKTAHAFSAMDTLVITYVRDLTAEHWALIEQSGVKNLRLAQYESGLWLRREKKDGPFETIELSSTSLYYLKEAMQLVPDTLRRFVGEPLEFSEDGLAALKTELKRFKKLDFSTLPHTVQVIAPTAKQVHVRVQMRGAELLMESRAQRVWDLLTKGFGVPFDRFDVGSAQRELGDDPVERIKVWAKNKRARSMYLRLANGKAVAPLHKDKVSYTVLELPLIDPKQFRAALQSLLELAQPDDVVVLDVKLSKPPTEAEWKRVDAALKKAAEG